MDELVGAQEIERMLGVSRQRVQQLVKHPSFPAPAVVLGMGNVWRAGDVLQWAAERGREINV